MTNFAKLLTYQMHQLGHTYGLLQNSGSYVLLF